MQSQHRVLSFAVAAILNILCIGTPAYAAMYAPGATLDPACGPTDVSCGVTAPVDSGTATDVPYYSASGSTLAATSTIQILSSGIASTTGANLTASTLAGTTTNSGTIDGGVFTGYVGKHCTTIDAKGGISTTLPYEMTNNWPNAYTKVNMDTVLYDPDNAADIANSQIKVPSWAGHVQVFAHMDWSAQTDSNGYASIHLFRNDSYTAEAFYHTRVYYPMSATSTDYVTTYAASPVIPVYNPNETWQLYAWEDVGNLTVTGTQGKWLSVCFYH